MRVLIAGENREGWGEGPYWAKLRRHFDEWGDRTVFVGRLSDQEMAAFFAECDVTVLPSVNRSESFGLVQVESVLCGRPVVATDLPGIREPIRRSGMGALVPPHDSEALAEEIARIVHERLGLKTCTRRYTAWFNRRSDHYHLDGSETWRERLRRSGFSVVRQEYYLSRTAMFWFDLLHYVSIPSLLAFRRLGRWHWLGRPLFFSAWTALLTRLARRSPETEGAYVFPLARKV